METMVLEGPPAEASPDIEAAPANLEAKSTPPSSPEATSKVVGAAAFQACGGVCAGCFFADQCAAARSKSGTEPSSNNAVQTPNNPPRLGETTKSDEVKEPNNFVTGENFRDDPDLTPTGAGQKSLDEFLHASKKSAKVEKKPESKPKSTTDSLEAKPKPLSGPKPPSNLKLPSEPKSSPIESSGGGQTYQPAARTEKITTDSKANTEPGPEPEPKPKTIPEHSKANKNAPGSQPNIEPPVAAVAEPKPKIAMESPKAEEKPEKIPEPQPASESGQGLELESNPKPETKPKPEPKGQPEHNTNVEPDTKDKIEIKSPPKLDENIYTNDTVLKIKREAKVTPQLPQKPEIKRNEPNITEAPVMKSKLEPESKLKPEPEPKPEPELKLMPEPKTEPKSEPVSNLRSKFVPEPHPKLYPEPPEITAPINHRTATDAQNDKPMIGKEVKAKPPETKVVAQEKTPGIIPEMPVEITKAESIPTKTNEKDEYNTKPNTKNEIKPDKSQIKPKIPSESIKPPTILVPEPKADTEAEAKTTPESSPEPPKPPAELPEPETIDNITKPEIFITVPEMSTDPPPDENEITLDPEPEQSPTDSLTSRLPNMVSYDLKRETEPEATFFGPFFSEIKNPEMNEIYYDDWDEIDVVQRTRRTSQGRTSGRKSNIRNRHHAKRARFAGQISLIWSEQSPFSAF